MLRLYLLGGEDLGERGSRDINRQAFRDAGENPLVVVFPWTSRAKIGQDKYRRQMVDYFKEMGAKGVRFVEPTLPFPEMAKLVEESDMIYLPGGDPKVLVERMRVSGASLLLANYDKVILGNSAGAVALCAEYVLMAEDSDTYTVSSGLGLVDFGIAVHYDPYLDAQLESLSTSRNIFAIPEGGAVIISRCSISLVGAVAVFQEGKKV